MRLSHFVAQSGIASRRYCEAEIKNGKVSVNGKKVIFPYFQIDPEQDTIRYEDKHLRLEEKRSYLLHKPKGYICSSSDPYASRLARDLLPATKQLRLYNIGRLDRDSEGLVLFSNDGYLTQYLLHPRYGVNKVYLVYVQGIVKRCDLAEMKVGIYDKGEFLKLESATIVRQGRRTTLLKIMLRGGKKREIRRLFQRFHHPVKRLLRIAIGLLKLGKFNPGFWRELSANELILLHNHIVLPSNKSYTC